MAEFTAAEIAEMVGGELHGDGNAAIEDVSSLENAGEGDLTFVAEEKHAAEAAESPASAIISFGSLDGYDGAVIVCDDPQRAFGRVLARFAELRFPHPEGVSEAADVDQSATIEEGAAIGSGAVIAEDVVVERGAVIYPLAYVGPRSRVGRDSVVYPHVCIRADVTIGRRTVIHSNVAIGGDGFGYIQRDGQHVKMPHVGKVRIGDDVEIGSLVTIDRAMVDETVIKDGVKIDSHSHLAHNVQIGEGSLLVAYAKLAGSVKLGKGVLLAEDVGITDHVTVGDGARLAGGAGIRSDVPPGETMWGYPARQIKKQRRIWALQGKLPDMRQRIRKLEQEVEDLRARLEGTTEGESEN